MLKDTLSHIMGIVLNDVSTGFTMIYLNGIELIWENGQEWLNVKLRVVYKILKRCDEDKFYWNRQY